MRMLSCAVVGADYLNSDGTNRRSEIAFCDPGEPVFLVPEPKNEYDEHAIAVLSARNFQIGYIASTRAVLLGKLMRDGHELRAIFQDIAPFGAVARIGVDCHPTLPTGLLLDEADNADHADDVGHIEDEFYPDFLPPDE